MTDSKPSTHPARHYIRRRGRMTQGQSRALQDCAHRARLLEDRAAEIALQSPPVWQDVFRAHAEQHSWDQTPSKPPGMGVEIGFGMGQALVQWAQQEPSLPLVGIEVYQPGIGSLLLQAQEQDKLDQLYVIEADARVALELAFVSNSLREVRIFFPDPWHKARHNKRRLVQRDFLAVVADRLQPGGLLRLATDWEDYAYWMLEEAEATPGLVNGAAQGRFASRFAQRNVTRFEARGQRLGHDVWDLVFRAD